MSGHSKWATTKHKKAALDKKRAKLFANLTKKIEVTARLGGADLEGNPGLIDAIQRAKKSSVPNDNIDRAIKRGAGLVDGGVDYQTIMYEGYGPQGTAILIECLTENKNRAAADIRMVLSRNGGNMGDPGSVAYLFARKGVVEVLQEGKLTEDDILSIVLDAGVEEVTREGERFEILSDPSDLTNIRTALEAEKIEYESADIHFMPSMKVQLEVDNARKFMRLIEALEELDDVQEIYSNADISDEFMASVHEEE